jgi:hypothetical protein
VLPGTAAVVWQNPVGVGVGIAPLLGCSMPCKFRRHQ